jgi:Domain of unknown function (DUF4258)
MAIVHVIREGVRGCTSVAFDAHALKMMAERGVSEDDVVDVLRNPSHTNPRADENRLHFRGQTASGSTVDVVFEEDPTQIVVISVWRK